MSAAYLGLRQGLLDSRSDAGRGVVASSPSTDRPLSRLRAFRTTFFQKFLVAALLVGGCLVLSSVAIRSSDGNEYIVDLVRDLGIGLIVSVFVVVFIEWRAGLTLRAEIATDVLEAVYRNVVPDVIFKQVRDSIFRSHVLRTGWKLDIKVLPIAQHEDMYEAARNSAGSNEVYLIESEVSYDLKNLHDGTIEYNVSHGIDLDVPVKKMGIPRFTAVELGGKEELAEGRSSELFTDPPRKHGTLTLATEGNKQVRFSKQVLLPREGTTHVRYQLLRAIRAPGIYVLASSTPAAGIEIAIESTPELKFDVRPLHPQSEHLLTVEPGRRWKFTDGILPWQGFQIVSFPPSNDLHGQLSVAPPIRSETS